MAHFTMLLKNVIESQYNESIDPDAWQQPYTHFTYDGVTYGKLPYLDDYTKIGLGTYPIFDELYRPILNGKIIDEYFNQEIGTETIDNFALIMRKKMDQIMPYYNQLYQKIEYSALMSMDIHSVGEQHTEGNEEASSNSTSAQNTTSGSRSVSSETPQTMLSGDEDYASSAADTNSKSDGSANATSATESTNSADNNSDTHVTGYQGNASDMVMKYRASLINVDAMVIANIADCFMLMLNSDDDYFARENGWYC
jgi:hypothetical protein